MPQPTQTDLDNAVQAYRTAFDNAQKAGSDALEYMIKAAAHNQTSENDIFVQAASRALQAQEQHNKAAQLAVRVLFEISQMAPHLTPSIQS